MRPLVPRPSATMPPRVASVHQPSARYRRTRSSGTDRRPHRSSTVLLDSPTRSPSTAPAGAPSFVVSLGELRYHLSTWHSRSPPPTRRAQPPTTVSTPCGWAGSVRETAEASSFVLDVPADAPSCVRLRGRPVLHLQGVGRRPAARAVLLDVLLARRGHRAAGDREADPGRRGVQLDERPPGAGRHPRSGPTHRLLPPRPGTGRSGGVQRRERDHTGALAGQDGAGHDVATGSPPLRQPGP